MNAPGSRSGTEGIAFTEDDGETWTFVPADTTVSMNMWGFSREHPGGDPGRIPGVPSGQGLRTNPMKCEYFLPAVVSGLLEEEQAIGGSA